MTRILLVEDEIDILETTREILESEGYQVVTAPNGSEGLAAAERERPDLIVTDVMMPVMSGLEMLERLAKGDDDPTIPVIVTSAASTGREATQRLGHVFLPKPYDVDTLLRAVQRLVGRPQ